MKIAKALRDIYQDAQQEANQLKDYVDGILRPFCSSNDWHYVSRVKSDVSFALKIETGRFENPKELEDMFAATVVVPTSAQIKQAVEIIEANNFSVVNQRPADLEITTKLPETFNFDDLRLYVKYQQSPSLPYRAFLDHTFEIQIKTFLQHAWSIATHDLVYKSEKLDWTRARVSYQIKAMLEHAETTIASVDKVAEILNNKRYVEYEVINELIDVYKQFWSEDLLPNDLRRLGETTYKLIKKLDIQVTQVVDALEEAEAKGLAGKVLSLSPYQSLIVALCMKNKENFSSKLKNIKIPITSEMLDVFPGMEALKPNAIKLDED